MLNTFCVGPIYTPVESADETSFLHSLGLWWTRKKSLFYIGEYTLFSCKLKLMKVGHLILTLILLTWRIWWAPNNASKWQMGFNLVFKGLMVM